LVFIKLVLPGGVEINGVDQKHRHWIRNGIVNNLGDLSMRFLIDPGIDDSSGIWRGEIHAGHQSIEIFAAHIEESRPGLPETL